jgi:nonribosomal peptide synthetase protein BlmIV
VLEIARLERALRSVIQHHPMLRAVVNVDGHQQVLASVPAYEIKRYDLSGLSPEACEQPLADVREELSHQVLDTTRWPLFEVRASMLPSGQTRLHLSFDALIVDAQSLFRLLDEWHRFYVDPERVLLPARSTFVDYIAALEASKQLPAFEVARRYWRGRVETLPEPPELPLAAGTRVDRPTRFVRRTVRLGKAQWARLRRRAHEAEVTETVALLSAYADVLAAFSKSPHFLLNLTLFDRRALVADVESIVGDFTSISLLEIDARGEAAFGERAAAVQRRLFQDLDHRAYGGVQVLRDCARTRGRVGAPVVFTSELGFDGLGRDTAVLERFGRETYAITQTPQVWIDLQVLEVGGELVAYWDAVEDLFLPGVMGAMCAAFVHKLSALADGPDAWSSQGWLLGDGAALELPVAEPPVDSPRTLHERFVEQAQLSPARIAIVQGAERVSYGELLLQAQRIATALREHVEPGTLVGVALGKSPGQVAAVLGVLLAGAAYVPLDPRWPRERTARLLAQAQVDVVITSQTQAALPSAVGTLKLEALLASSSSAEAKPVKTLPSQLAYVIFTSGSTGTPKGVMISHQAAWNTIADVLKRMEVVADDAVFGISSLSFDLSVFDIFGPLSVGARLVLPAPDQLRDPAHWLRCLQREKVTLWSSVPALVELLASAIPPSAHQAVESLRVVMMSGDWIAPTLPGRLRALGLAAKLFSLGGATEGSIWSIVHPIDEVDASWTSIPYGRAMTGQQVEVLDAQYARRPAWVTGELCLGGFGVALGYLGDEARTARAFVVDAQTGQRWYRTGDLGRLHPDGTVELLGREDGQVKINGYRVELGEVEAALNSHPDVHASAVLALGERGRRRLGAVFVPRTADLTVAQVRAHVAARVPEYMLPTQLLSVASLPLTSNGKLDRAALEKLLATESRAALEPISVLESAVRDVWAEVLERPADSIGALSNFFDAGGDSLSAIKLRSRLGQLFARTELPITFVFEHATVRAQTRTFSEPVAPADAPRSAAARRGQLRRAATVETSPQDIDAGRARR